ncbi:putative Meiotic activator RIM4 [Glarea lozoyensis 74030]|uniref:Putative Meiotic activator RIM4 n=1 Tax=Glarea lozoyensis (strain ATCC 74030 / MF5533) TaxID=1104152 RepID=H0EZN3_GLAL7|nr:putative Meiotic activator RIM4 [Glarea lozoyensis 74030]
MKVVNKDDICNEAIEQTDDEGEQQPAEHGGVSLSGVAKLSLDDNDKKSDVKVKLDCAGAYSADCIKAKSPESSSPIKAKGPFVLKGNLALADDPFASPPRNSSSENGAAQTSTATHKRSSENRGSDSSNWRRSGSSLDNQDSHSEEKSDHVIKKVHNEAGDKALFDDKFLPEGANDEVASATLVKDENSQSIFPPSCCVFVANLLQSESEESLQVAVTQIFREYGSVYVKIRRDGKQMPFAFCQYTTPEHAERAIREGRGRLIKGRPCRCEKAKAHRLFFVERKYGAVVTPQEVLSLFETFGTITQCYTATPVERTSLNLNEGVILEFELYDVGQAAFAAFRNHDVYKIQAVAGMASTPPRPTRHVSTSSADRDYLDRYEVDRRSIFVGNLPMSTTEAQIAQLFEHYGTINNIVVREATSKYDGAEKFCFAFVEFNSAVAVTRAIPAKNGFSFGGKVLRVSQKDPDAATKKRSAHSRGLSISAYGSSPQSPHEHRRGSESISQMSPAAFQAQNVMPPSNQQYGAPPFSPMSFASPGSTLYHDGNGQYFAATTSYNQPQYAYYGYPAVPSTPTSPTYTTAPPPSVASGSPMAYPSGYSYYNGQYVVNPYSPMGMPAPSYGGYHQPQQVASFNDTGATSNGETVHEDRSATPTPAGHGSATTEPTLESQ